MLEQGQRTASELVNHAVSVELRSADIVPEWPE